MKRFLVVAIFVISICISNVDGIISPKNEELEVTARMFNDWRKTRETFMDAMKHPMGLPHYECPLPALEAVESVHRLHPSQIDVIAALGDSVSVAQAAKSSSVFDLLKQYPGVSFVTGDDEKLEDQATLINIFGQFSRSIKGGSSDNIRKFYDFNFAIPGSFSYELPEQAENLVNTFAKRLRKDNEKFWKFVNIFIGHNDLCKVCENQTLYGPEKFGKSIRTALSIVHSEVPNVFVNIMPPINVQIHSQAHNVSEFCEFSHRQTCPCIFDLSKDEYSKIKQEFNDQLKQVVEEFNQKTSKSTTFAVVLAPAMDLKAIPLLGDKPNVGLLALDCFHLSPIAHDIAAKQIWRGLFEPVENKSVTSQLSVGFDKFVCPPTTCPYLRTNKNSDNCEPPKQMKLLEMASDGINAGLTFPMFMIPGFFIMGTALILLFVRASIRRTSSGFSDERVHLLPPMRTDLNDNIF